MAYGKENAGAKTANVRKKPLHLYDLHAIPRDIILGYVFGSDLIKIASFNEEHRNWIRGYFSRFKILNVKPYSNKYCVSSEPCSATDSSCRNGKNPHRVFGATITIKAFIELGLSNVDTICIEAPTKPREARAALHGVKEVCALFTHGIQRVFISVSKEEPYVEIVESLLNNNDATIQEFNVRSSNSETSLFRFAQFETRTRWFAQDFPMLAGYKKRKLKMINKKKRVKRLEQALPQQDDPQVLNHVVGFVINLDGF